jgi:CheY-like chemotaxis protein
MLSQSTVLVVDDEELLRDVVAMMIEDNGADVLCAQDGNEGVKTFKENVDKVKCVVMDFSMPGMNGYEALCAMREVNKDIPIILVSGLESIPEVSELRKKNEIGFLSKPFQEDELIRTINKYIAR